MDCSLKYFPELNDSREEGGAAGGVSHVVKLRGQRLGLGLGLGG